MLTAVMTSVYKVLTDKYNENYYNRKW